MKKAATHGKSKLVASVALLAVGALALGTWMVSATDAEDEKKPLVPFFTAIQDDEDTAGWKGYIIFGGGGVDEEGITGISGRSAGRTAEYSVAEATPLLGIFASYDNGSDYLKINSFILNFDDTSNHVYGSAGRVFITNTTLNRFIHRLDNDLMTDWQPPFTVDPQSAAAEMEMRVTVLNSENRFKLASIPSSVLFAHVKLIAREGDRQARTFDHCTSCHVSTTTQSLDQSTLALVVGGEYAKAPYAVRYQHEYRSFSDSSEALSYTYLNRFGNFELEGTQPFAVTPDNTRNTDIGAARLDISPNLSATARLRLSSVENDNTGFSKDTTSFSGRLNFVANEWLRLRGSYTRLEIENDTPFSSSRERNRFDGALLVRPVKELKLEGLYRWEKVERTGGTEVEETVTKSFRIKAIYRPTRELKLVASHRFVDIEDPFGRVLRNSFSRIEDVLLSPLGTSEDETDVMLTYCPAPGSNLTVNYHRTFAENPTHGMESTLQSFSAGGNVALNKKATVFGSYSYYSNEYDRDVYLGVLAPFLTITRIPYEGTGNTFGVGAWIQAGKLSLRPSYYYTTAESSFDDTGVGGTVADFSSIDATVNRVMLEAGYPLTDRLDVSIGYFQDKYEDGFQPQDDGTVHWFYGWLGYRF